MTRTILAPTVLLDYGANGGGVIELPGVESWFIESTNMHVAAASIKILCDCLNKRTLEFDPIKDNKILAVIGFGSAFKPISYTKYFEKRFKWFGPMIEKRKRISAIPSDVDFLIITEKNCGVEKYFAPKLRHYYEGTAIEQMGMHCVARGIDQFLLGIKTNEDTVSISGLAGVLLFADESFETLILPNKISSEFIVSYKEERNQLIVNLNSNK